MSQNTTTLITKQTDAATVIKMFDKSYIDCSLVVDGTLVDEEITIEYVGADDSTTTTAKDEYGSNLVLSLDNPALPIKSACYLKITKPVTTNAVGVEIHGA